jgi:hypothetical protein
MLNVKYYIYPRDVQERGDYIHNQFMERKDLVLRYTDDKVSIYQNPKAYSRAFMVHSFVRANDPPSALRTVFSESFDPASEAVVETEDDLSAYSSKPAKDGVIPAGTVKITGYLPNSVDITVDTPASGILVLADNYDDGWHVYVDGAKGRIYRANYIMRGVCLERGRHKVRFIYDPWYFKAGMAVTSSAVIAVLLAFIKIMRTNND